MKNNLGIGTWKLNNYLCQKIVENALEIGKFLVDSLRGNEFYSMEFYDACPACRAVLQEGDAPTDETNSFIMAVSKRTAAAQSAEGTTKSWGSVIK